MPIKTREELVTIFDNKKTGLLNKAMFQINKELERLASIGCFTLCLDVIEEDGYEIVNVDDQPIRDLLVEKITNAGLEVEEYTYPNTDETREDCVGLVVSWEYED